MQDILRVQDLIRELEGLPLDAPVMIAVVKYPSQFEVADDWDRSQAVEVIPIESGEVYSKDGRGLICVELTDFNEEMDSLLPGKTSSS